MLYNSSKLVVQLFIPERAVGKKILIMDKQLTARLNLANEDKILVRLLLTLFVVTAHGR